MKRLTIIWTFLVNLIKIGSAGDLEHAKKQQHINGFHVVVRQVVTFNNTIRVASTLGFR